MEKRTIHSHWLRSPIQHQDPNKSNLGCFQTFWKRRKEMITMLSTKNGMQEQCISLKNTLSLEASLLSSVLLPLLSLSENYWHELQITKILFTTNPHAHQRGHSDYHILHFKTCNENSSLCQNQKSRMKVPLSVCPFASLRWMCFQMSMATRSTDLHKEIKISHLHNLPSANWTYLAGNPCRKRKFWPDHL